MMKKLLLLFAVAGFAALTSCGGNEPAPEPLITLVGGQTNQNVWADQTTGTGQVSFETTASWTSSITKVGTTRDTAPGVPATWVTITPSSGSAGRHNITIALEDNFTGADRTAIITINCGGEKIIITVTQKSTTASGEPHVEVIPVTGVQFDESSYTVVKGEAITITGTYTPANATFTTFNLIYIWDDDGTVGAGTAQDGVWSATLTNVQSSGIIAPIFDRNLSTAITTSSATLTVTEPEPVAVTSITLMWDSEVSIDPIGGSAYILLRDTFALVAVVTPENATDKAVTWSSSNPAVVEIFEIGDNRASIQGVALGTATITATAGGKTASSTVEVLPRMQNLRFDQNSYNVQKGGTVTLTGTWGPYGAQRLIVEIKDAADTYHPETPYMFYWDGTFEITVTEGVFAGNKIIFIIDGVEATCTLNVVTP